MQLIHYDKLIDEKILYFIYNCFEIEIESPRYLKTRHVQLYVHKDIIINVNNKGSFILVKSEIDIRYKHSGKGSFLYLTPEGFFKHNISLGEE